MAEADKKPAPNAEQKDAPKAEAPKTENKDVKEAQPKTAAKTGMLTYVIMVVVVLVLAGSGFFLGRIFAGGADPNAVQEEVNKPEVKKEEKKEVKKEEKKGGHGGHGAKEEEKPAAPVLSPTDTWYFSGLESVVVNPDEPGATRYVRVGLNLEFGGDFASEEAEELINAKKPLLINWLNLYFKSLTLNQMQNDRDMKRMLVQICDAFNEILFPDEKPKIKKILIREFNIQ
ncbi:MAG: flagellar basal body-associated FliL family protein [Planctomycetaceae bacterium]|nr:flagellar basal body-associated FliL family protein [Planctomycetaceae bacterium]